jgi:uncharacterized protein YdeI (YjbR/CyaY-like superfamily)
MNQTNLKADALFNKAKKWQEEMKELRAIVLDCQLTEEIKWYQPCYTFENNNVVIISAFKEYCALNFFKGALIKDPEGVLIAPSENVQSGRQMRFISVDQIIEMEPIIKAYLSEAIEVEKAGLKVEYKQTSEYEFPEELQQKLDENPALKKAFESLTPGRQRGYLLYFSAPKQSKTRAARIDKYTERIFNGKGLNDR